MHAHVCTHTHVIISILHIKKNTHFKHIQLEGLRWRNGSGIWKWMRINKYSKRGDFHGPMMILCHESKSIFTLNLFLRAIVNKNKTSLLIWHFQAFSKAGSQTWDIFPLLMITSVVLKTATFLLDWEKSVDHISVFPGNPGGELSIIL